MKIDLGQINPGAVAQISIDYMFKPVQPSTINDKLDQLMALQDQDGHFNWGDALLDFTGKTKEEWTSMRPRFTRRIDWITAIAIVLLMVEDNTEAATLKARGYLSSHLSENKVAKLIEKAYLKLKPLVSGLEGKDQLFMRQCSERQIWKRRLVKLVLKGVLQVVASVTTAAIVSSL
jgi:hypothetical protein